MPYNSFDPVLQDSEAFRNALIEAFTQASQRIQRPSWMDAWGQFIRQHPWISLGVAFFVIFLLTAFIRELICGYLKTNEILARLKRLEDKIK
ncbi:hypothetical protein BU251_08150 [Candidatus Velamenicoccus archaeovorus]|uniref:Uncharacterized protein n=1 Tax=Velamenicoccus archaeovorus TaxID=1930593 RepID=A0A410P6A5_VELA1|nr:hypothetical protein [Candidatus Velamenicoccus archaeovorus]QAT17693.1 hypothetical protein BU251_08150 [Candidatus Velamenicoccus archaeovorus]